MSSGKFKKYISRLFRVLAWVLASAVLIIFLVVLVLQFPGVQTYIAGRVASHLSEETGAEITIERVAIRFPRSVNIRNIYIEDPQGDTLVSAGRIYADITMTALLRSRLHVNTLEIDDLTAFIIRETPDTVFNFQFLADAFAADTETTTNGETTTNDEADADDENGFSLFLNTVNLRNINISFEDHFSGTDLSTSLGYLHTSLADSDLLNNKYHAGNTEIRETSIWLFAYEPSFPAEEPSEEVPDIDISLTSLELADFGFLLESTDGSRLNIETELLSLIPESINLQDQFANISSLITENLRASIVQPPGTEDTGALAETGNNGQPDIMETEFRFSEIMDWTVGLDRLEINNSFISIGTDNQPVSKETFDPDNFTLGNLELNARNLFVAPDSLNIDINDMSMLVSEIFNLEHLELDISMGRRAGNINLLLLSAGSNLDLTLNMDANLLNFSFDDLLDRRMVIEMEDTSIDNDMAFFLPVLKPYYFDRPGADPLEIRSRITGTPANITIDSLRVTGPELFWIFAGGDVSGLPDTDNLYIDLLRLELWARPALVMANLPDIQQPEGINLPEYIMMEGQFLGTFTEFETEVFLQSNLGDIEMTATVYEDAIGESSFNGSVTLDAIDVAQLSQAEILQQPVSLYFDFSGRGLDMENIEPETMELEAELGISHLMLMDYPYDEIMVFLTLKDSIANISTTYDDEFLAFDLDAETGIFKETITAKTELNIDYADLGQLGFSQEDVIVTTSLGADIMLYPEDFFSGSITISETNLAINGDIYTIPEVLLISDSKQEDYSFELIADFMSAVYKGNFTPAGIPEALADHLAEYFTLPETAESQDELPAAESGEYDTEYAKAAGNRANSGNPDNGADSEEVSDSNENKHFELNINIYPSDVISNVFLPPVEEYDTLSLLLEYDSQAQNISVNATMEDIQYAGMRLQNFRAGISSDKEKMDFEISLDSLNMDEISFYNFDVSGSFFDEKIDFSFSFQDEQQEDIFFIGALVESREELIHFSIDPENLVINYEPWEIHPENRIVTGHEILQFDNFMMEHQESMLSVNSRTLDENEEEEYEDITDITVSRLDLLSLTSFATDILPLKGGMLDGTMTVRNIHRETSFTADMDLAGFAWGEHKIESISLFAEDVAPGQIFINAALEHEGTALRASGDFFPGEIPSVDIEVLMENLDMSLIEMFAGDELTDVSGTISGKINVTGSLESPEITGEMNFHEAGFRVTQLNATYLLKEEQIRFDQHRVTFPNFIIRDYAGRTATIDGNVNIEDFDNLILNLDFNTGNFMLMDLPRRRGEMYYGTILIDSDLRIRGGHLNPSVSGTLRLREGSDFTFIVPQTTPEAIGGEGVVEFIPPQEEEFFRRVVEREEADELRSSLEVMTVALNVELDRETQLSVIIDEIAGDYLELQGGGVLSFDIDPGGAINLTGRYEIVEGEYMLSFHEVARRRFGIREGSSIVFTGDPLDAELDITAVYTVRTSPEQLMRPVGGGNISDGGVRRQLPFMVYLNLEGELMAPNISFGLDMPPEHQDAFEGSLMARINAINEDESERNKQVFALLILGSFIHESPFATGDGPGIATTARSSASQILSQQLNRLSDRYVRGVDISFELESYEVNRDDAAVGRTELQVEVSRRFFDDRIRVMVAGNVELEDDTHRETSPGDIAGDFTLEYLLTPAGDLLLRGFRRKEYGDIIDGELTTTGLSVVFSKSFTRFRDLFRREDETAVPFPEEAGVLQNESID